MIERFQKIMEYAGVSPKRFAEILGIERSNVSHIMSGRNNPSLTVVQKILKNFPDISSDWLLFGEGNMLKANATANNVAAANATANNAAAVNSTSDNTVEASASTPLRSVQNANTQPVEPKVVAPAAPEPTRTKVDKPTPPQQHFATVSTTAPTAPNAAPKKNIEYQTITTPIVNDTNVQPTTAQIQNLLANGLIVLDHSTKTFTIYTQGK
ncbi:MAG: helix-turn-helix domain-containing protein [Bacteroidales bacterium]|nr:helix-turn-helix domain-containing protein [Bacteroidales bacterium]